MLFWIYIDTSTLIKIICKMSQKLWVIHSFLLNMFLLLRFFSGFDLIFLNLYTLKYATSSLISGLLISDLFLLFHALLVLNYTTTFNPLYYRKIFLMPFLTSSRVQMLSLTIQMKKHFYRRAVFLTSTSSTRKGSRKEVHYIIFVWSKTPTLRRYLSIPFNDIRKRSVKLRRTVSVV